MIIDIIKTRFLENTRRHPDIPWDAVEAALLAAPYALAALERMEQSGGEPDVIGRDESTGRLIFCDCAKESPAARRSLCYDDEALQKRSKNPPAGSALRAARDMGTELLTEALYRRLQQTGEYDMKSSSWIATPDDIRRQGGALFCERRYGVVFVFHNGADSYYSTRGWRGYFML